MPARAATAAALLLTLVLANATRLWAGMTAPAARGLFTGQLWGAYDLPQYVEAIREGSAGRLLFEGRVWALPYGRQYLFETPYLLGGLLLGPLHLGPFAILEVLRWVAQAAALGCLVVLVRAAVPPAQRPWAVLFATVGGGLGWLFLSRPPTPLGPVLPMDVATPSFDLLNGFLASPHLALVAAALVLFAWGFLAVGAGRRRGFLALVALPLALTVHPFEIVPLLVAAVVTVALAARTRALTIYLGLAVLLTAAEAGYLAWLALQDDPVVAVQSAASATAEIGTLPGLLVSRAIVLPLAIAAVAPLRRRLDPTLLLLGTWALVSALLNVVPFDAAAPFHRTLEGSSAAFGCLAALGVARVAARWRPVLLGAALLSPLVQAGGLFAAASAFGEAWVPAPIVALAGEADARGLRGAVLGDAAGVRWVVALSGLREAVDDPGAAHAETAQVLAGAPLAGHGADYLLATGGGAPPGLRPVVEVEGAALYG